MTDLPSPAGRGEADTARSARLSILVIGLGNPILGDDGIGWRIALEVQSRLESARNTGAPQVEFDFLSLGGLSLMERLVGYRHALLIDAIVTGHQPIGSISQFELQDLPPSGIGHLASAHDTSLRTAIEMGRVLQASLPDSIHIIAVETQISFEFSESLSPPVAAAVQPAASLALEWLTSISH
jgi:hydrogenase maturation protease